MVTRSIFTELFAPRSDGVRLASSLVKGIAFIYSSNASESFTSMQAKCNAYAMARPGVKGTCTVNNAGTTEVYWYAGQTLDKETYGSWTAAARCNGQP